MDESLGPWTIKSIIEKKSTVYIAQTDDPDIVVKVCEESLTQELMTILNIFNKTHTLRNAIELPATTYKLFGVTPKSTWYAMRRYDGPIERNDICRSRWRKIGLHVLQFLQDLHTNFRKVHMDIKMKNILMDKTSSCFVVADYQLVDDIRPAATNSFSDDYKWYYLAMGAEPHEPLFSWRMDLTALGFMLLHLTSENEDSAFSKECSKRRKDGNYVVSLSYILEMRSSELLAAPETLKEYFKAVQNLSWSSPDPPSVSFYNGLQSLFY